MDTPLTHEPNVAFELDSTHTPAHSRLTASRRLSNFHVSSYTSRVSRPSALRSERQVSFSRETPSHRRQSHINRRLTLNDGGTNASNTPRSIRHRAQPLSSAEIAEIYSSTIKLCQSNKINSRNTWSLNLIDYMPMLVRPNIEQVSRTVSFDDTPQNPHKQRLSTTDTDFQFAGVTLDAGVKIYCSRVDSVHSNAFRVLGGLAQTDADEDDSPSNIDFENEDGTDHQRDKPRLNNRPGRATLETNLRNITIHKLETDLAVDPLFQKMTAAFDEGGASGMLINNLPTGVGGQKIFDSSEFASVLVPEKARKSSDTTYDISCLLPNPPRDEDKLCSKFRRFFRDRMGTESNMSTSSQLSEVMESNFPPHSHDSVHETVSSWPSEEPSQIPAEFEYDDNDLDDVGDIGVSAASSSQIDSFETEESKNQADEDDVNIFSTSFSHSSLPPSDTTQLGTKRGAVDLVDAGMTLLDDDEYGFFSRTALSTWAGPQHWRFRAGDLMTTQKKRKPRKARGKTAMLLDFSSEAPAIDFDKQFAQGKTNEAHQLTAKMRDNLAEKKVTLPEDLHLSPRWLTALFLKPGVFVRTRGSPAKGVNLADEEQPCDDGWYNIGNDCDNNSLVGDFIMDDDGTNDDIDVDPDDVSGVDLIPEPTRVEAVDITYAKVAKKVDVRALKTGLWAQLCGESGFTGDETSTLKNTDDEERSGENSDVRNGGIQDMQTIVRDINKFVPESSLSDVTLPYVFICLLHLANEKGLRIEQSGGPNVMENLMISFDNPVQL